MMTPNAPRTTALALTLVLALGGCANGEPETSEPSEAADTASTEDSITAVRAIAADASLISSGIPSGTDELVQAIHPVSADIIWASGHGGTFLRSVDGGAEWSMGVVQGHEEAEFRDVHAFNRDEALLMAAGPGDASRILLTEDAGESWTEVFVMDHPDGFLDCMAFWDFEHGIAYGDSVDGELYILRTVDGGTTWSRVNPATLPAALDGEGGFAASGSCARSAGPYLGWIATGNGAQPRMLATETRGETWQSEAITLPLDAGASRGGTTIAVRPNALGFAMGGNIGGGAQGARIALTADGGTSWSQGGEYPLGGAIYGADWVGLTNAIVAVGPGGIAWSRDAGMTWEVVDTLGHWAVEFTDRSTTGFATGPNGRVTRLEMEEGR